jgi:hypothetical protein
VLITVTPRNRAPIAHAGPDQTVSVGADAQANVTLDSSASYDPDGDRLLYIWTVGAQTYETSITNPTIQLPTGQHTLVSVDPDGAPLQYIWSWTVGGQTVQATGMSPVSIIRQSTVATGRSNLISESATMMLSTVGILSALR